MKKAEIQEQRAILKQLNYWGNGSVGELVDFVSNLIELLHRSSKSASVKISSADLRLQLEMLKCNQIKSKAAFLRYKHAVLKEVNWLNNSSWVEL
jgi:hypothetical protein